MFYRSSGTEGSITINGHERNLSSFRKLSAYIMQDNQLHGNLTVEESMKVASSLKLSKHIPKEEKNEVVNKFKFIFIITNKKIINHNLFIFD